MEKVIFEERGKKNNKTTAVRISEDNHRKIMDISERSHLPVYMVADKLIAFALDRVDWKDRA